jgi:hypothetical protein
MGRDLFAASTNGHSYLAPLKGEFRWIVSMFSTDAASQIIQRANHGSPPQVIDASRSRRERRTPSSAISPKPAISIAHVFGSGTPVVNWAEPPND